MSILNPKEDVAEITPLVQQSEERLIAAIRDVAGHLFDGYTINITIEVKKQP